MSSEKLCKESILYATLEVATEFEKELYGSNKYNEIKKWGSKTFIEFPPVFSPCLYAHLIDFIQLINELPIQNEMIKYLSRELKKDLIELYKNALAVTDYRFLVSMMLRIGSIVRECISSFDIADREEKSTTKEYEILKAED